MLHANIFSAMIHSNLSVDDLLACGAAGASIIPIRSTFLTIKSADGGKQSSVNQQLCLLSVEVNVDKEEIFFLYNSKNILKQIA